MRLLDERTVGLVKDLIEYRFQSSLKLDTVLRWLSNFDEADLGYAMEVFSRITYYSYDHCLSVLNNQIRHCLKDTKAKCLVFVPIGAPGKSGNSILYCIHSLRLNNCRFCANLEAALISLKQGEQICFVDDIIGSGMSFIEYLKATHFDSDIPASLIAIALMDKGKAAIESQLGIKCYGERHLRAFDKDNSLFGGRIRRSRIREFCYCYGKGLVKNSADILGFCNSQALIAFSHSTPNNTLPIVWANKTVDGGVWHPLFPRFPDAKLALGRERRIDKNRALVLAKELFGYDEVTQDLFSNTNLYILDIVRMKHMVLDDLSIARILGLPSDDMDEFWQLGLNLNIWDENHKLSAECVERYHECLKKIKFSRSRLSEWQSAMDFDLTDEIYIPETFMGVS